jgi:branched-chain amino acid transport system permease protein
MRLAVRRVPLVSGALVVAALALAPAGLSPFLVQFLINLFMLAALAESWNIIGGFTGYASFGNVAFFGIGAYTTGVSSPWRGGPSRSRCPRAACWPWRSPD